MAKKPTKVKNNQIKTVGQNGGARPGAGRKKGVPNKRTAALTKAVEESGLTPLEVMLSNMRWAMKKVDALGADQSENIDGEHLLLINGMRKVAQDAAKDAAPYVHARLASSEIKIEDKRSRDELIARADELHDRYGAKGIRGGAGGETRPSGVGKPH